MEAISADFRAAALASRITSRLLNSEPEFNQSIGNQAAEFFALDFPPHLGT